MVDKETTSILVIEDDDDIREAIVSVIDEITSVKFEVEQCECGDEGLKKVLQGSHDLILTDIKLPKVEGDQIIFEARKSNIKTPIIVLSGYLGESDLRQKLDIEDVYLLEKPFESDTLVRSIGMLVERLMKERASSV